jgi:heptosyltransferase-2
MAMKRIAVFLPNWIGDVVMATPAIRALREHFREVSLICVSKPYVADTLAGAPWFDETVLFDKKGPPENQFRGALKRLSREPLDAAVLFPNSFRPALLAKLAGAREIVGFARYFRDFLLTRRLYATRNADGSFKPVPVIDDYNRIVQLLDVPDPGHRMELFTTDIDETAAERSSNNFSLHRFPFIVGLNPGGAFGSSKHWPTEYFVELSKSLVKEYGCGVLVLCGPSERQIAQEIVNKSQHANVMSLADEPLSIGLTKAMVRRLRLLITTDSGPRHFAAAFDVPVVSLFGPTHIGWTETYFDKAIHLQLQVPCGPCQLRVCPLDHRCMIDLKPSMVLTAANQLLRGERMDSLHTEHRHAC